MEEDEREDGDERDEGAGQESAAPEIHYEGLIDVGADLNEEALPGAAGSLASDEREAVESVVDSDAPWAPLERDSAADSPAANSADAASTGTGAADLQAADLQAAERLAMDGLATQRERIAHPTRYSAVTGARAPAGQFYLPSQPPMTPENRPASADGPETGAAAAGDTSVPDELAHKVSQGVYVPQRGREAERPASAASDSGAREDVGQPLPRVLVTVSMASARTLFDEVFEETSREMAERFRKLAVGEIEQAAFWRKAAERAADYRLRGPTF